MSVSRDEIRRLFADAPERMSTMRTTLACVDAGVIPESWIRNAGIRAAQNEVREALRECDIRGLPFAGRTAEKDEDGAPVWEQRELWDYPTYVLNIEQHVTLARTNQEKAALMAHECHEKFGRSPRVPMLIGGAPQTGAAD